MPIRILALFFFCGLVSALAQGAQTLPGRSTVYSAHDPAAIKDYRTDPAVVHAMVDRLLLAVTGQNDRVRAWRSLVSPNDKIGIKISAAGGELFTTHRDVVNAIVDGLVAAGHSRSSIIVWDRSLGGMKDAGYRPSAEGYRVKSIAPRDGYDPKAIFTAPLPGKLIWGDLDFRTDRGTIPLLSDQEQTSDESHFSRIVSSEVTKIINVPVMSDSSFSGLAGCLYNVTIPNIDNWRRFTQVRGYGGAAIAELYNNPVIGKKLSSILWTGWPRNMPGARNLSPITPCTTPLFSPAKIPSPSMPSPCNGSTNGAKRPNFLQSVRWRLTCRSPRKLGSATQTSRASKPGTSTGEIPPD